MNAKDVQSSTEKRRSSPPDCPESSALKRTLVGAAWLSLQPLILNAISVPVTAYIIHRLGADGYGKWMIAAALLAFFGIFTNLGLRGSFIRHVAQRPNEAEAALADQLGLRLALSVLAAAIGILTCVLLGYSPIVRWCASVCAVGLVLTTIVTTLSDLLQAFQRMRTLAAINFSSGLILTLISLWTAWIDASPVSMALAYLTGPLSAMVMLLVVARRNGHAISLRCDLRRWRRLLSRCRFFAAQQLLAAGGTHAESLILPRLVGTAQFGFFSAGTILATRLAAFPDGLSTAAYPAMSSRCATDAREASGVVLRYLAFAVIGGSILAMLGAFVAEPIGRLLFPHEPELFVRVVLVTIWSVPLVGIELIIGSSLNAAGKDAEQARASVPAALTSLATCVGLVLAFGVAGACWAMLLRPLIRSVFLVPLMARTFWGSTRSTPVDGSSDAITQPRSREAA